jgi:hypothetical protein
MHLFLIGGVGSKNKNKNKKLEYYYNCIIKIYH